MMAKVEPIVNSTRKTRQMSAPLQVLYRCPHVPRIPIKIGLYFVLCASRKRKKPIDSLMKLYAKMTKIE